MYITIHSYENVDEHGILVYIRSNLFPKFPEFLQQALSSMMDPSSNYYRPGVSWDTDDITILYHGLAEEPETRIFALADGRTAQMWNINFGCQNEVAQEYKGYAAAIDLARASLMLGDSYQETARKVWEFCRSNGIYPAVIIKPKMSFQYLLDDMKYFREALVESIRELSPFDPHWNEFFSR